MKKSLAYLCVGALLGVAYGNTLAADLTQNGSGLANSYVGIGKDPTGSDDVLMISTGEKVTEESIDRGAFIDYRNQSIKLNNNNANGDGALANRLDKNNYGALAIGNGAGTSHGMSSAMGTYSFASIYSTAVGAGSKATSKSSALGLSSYANNKAVAMGDYSMADTGVAIGYKASAGDFFKYVQNSGSQSMKTIISSLAIGNEASATGGIAIGSKAVSNTVYGLSIGYRSSVDYSGVAIGSNASVKVDTGIALGISSVSDRRSGALGYVPFSFDGKSNSITANDLAKLGGAIGKEQAGNFNTKYSTQITQYNELNKSYSEALNIAKKQEDIIRQTAGSKDPDEQKAYEAAKAEHDKANKELVRITNERNAWSARNRDFTDAMDKRDTELSAFRATDGAISIGVAPVYNADKTIQRVAMTRQLTNLAAGTEDTDAVNVAQLRYVADETSKKANIDASNITPDQINKWQVALGINQSTIGNVDAITLSEGNNVKIDATYNDDKSRVNYKISVDDNNIKNSVMTEVDKKLDTKANRDASNLTVDDVNGWKDTLGVNRITDNVTDLQEHVNGLDNRVNKLDERVDKVGAGAAALAGLHPLEFNPEDKFSASVAMGSYKGQAAAALGGFYRPNADTMFSLSSTIGEDPMFNIGVSLKFGQKGDNIYRNSGDGSFRDLTNEVTSLKKENKALNDKMTEKEKSFEATNKILNNKVMAQQVELEQQRILIQQLMAKVGM